MLVEMFLQRRDSNDGWCRRGTELSCSPDPRPIRLMFRMIASESGTMLRQPIIVDNRPGASSMIGAVARAPTDGYTPLGTG